MGCHLCQNSYKLHVHQKRIHYINAGGAYDMQMPHICKCSMYIQQMKWLHIQMQHIHLYMHLVYVNAAVHIINAAVAYNICSSRI